MVIMPSANYTTGIIIEAIYNHVMKTGDKVFNVDQIHLIIMEVHTASARSIANYLKKLCLLKYIDTSGGGFRVTDKLMEQGKILSDKRNMENIVSKVQKSTDETGFFKY